MWKRGTRHTRETHRFPSPRWIGTLRSLRTPAPKGPAVRFTQVTATHLVKKRRARRRVAQAQCMSPTGAIRTSSVVSCRQGNGSAAVFAGDSGCFCGELCLRDKQKNPPKRIVRGWAVPTVYAGTASLVGSASVFDVHLVPRSRATMRWPISRSKKLNIFCAHK